MSALARFFDATWAPDGQVIDYAATHEARPEGGKR